MKFKFSKMHGCGNDYVYVDCTQQEMSNPEAVARYVSRYHYGIGSDGLILICPSEVADFKMRMFNADGSEGKMCGNGIRCVAKYVYDYHLTDKNPVSIETLGGIKTIDLIIDNGKVTEAKVDMGQPETRPRMIPMITDHYIFVDQSLVLRETTIVGTDNKTYKEKFFFNGTAVSMGNPHFVVFVPDVDELSAIPLTALFDNVIILRGTSKFFATPGLRLGYAITSNSQILTDINTNKNPWMINSLAVVAGETMFLDEEYIDKTRSMILSEKNRCKQLIEESHKFKLYPSYSNFYLLKILDEGVDAHMLFERAIRQGMMIRDCSTFPGLKERFIRFCIMKPEDNTRLINCLTQ